MAAARGAAAAPFSALIFFGASGFRVVVVVVGGMAAAAVVRSDARYDDGGGAVKTVEMVNGKRFPNGYISALPSLPFRNATHLVFPLTRAACGCVVLFPPCAAVRVVGVVPVGCTHSLGLRMDGTP